MTFVSGYRTCEETPQANAGLGLPMPQLVLAKRLAVGRAWPKGVNG